LLSNNYIYAEQLALVPLISVILTVPGIFTAKTAIFEQLTGNLRVLESPADNKAHLSVAVGDSPTVQYTVTSELMVTVPRASLGVVWLTLLAEILYEAIQYL
jgi:hypothetical protein